MENKYKLFFKKLNIKKQELKSHPRVLFSRMAEAWITGL